MNGLYFDQTESRIAIAALQMLERKLAARLDDIALESTPENPDGEHLSPEMKILLDMHDAVSALILQLATAGAHWVDSRGVDMTQDGLRRYINLLAESVEHTEIAQDEFLLDPRLQSRQAELSKSSALLRRIEQT